MKKSVIFLIPVYNDVQSLQTLIGKLTGTLINYPDKKFSFLVVNDGSAEPLVLAPSKAFTIQVLNLHHNIGHQKAIAIGLAHIHDNMPCDHVLIMDGDGEDQPEDAVRLLNTTDETDKIIVVRRKRRNETFSFQFFYFIYKILFRWLTGKRIAFGNFMMIPRHYLDKLVYYSEIWNHLPAGIIKSELPFTSIAANRGTRYAGSSKMNFQSLVMHGLGSIAVFLERVTSRLLIFSVLLIMIGVLIILLIILIRSFTNLAIPGWASTIVSSMLIILLQGFLLSLFTVFLFLSFQSQHKFIPAHHYKDYTASIETIANA